MVTLKRVKKTNVIDGGQGMEKNLPHVQRGSGFPHLHPRKNYFNYSG